jgi:hypothetical protein
MQGNIRYGQKTSQSISDVEVRFELSMTEVVCTVDFELELEERIAYISQDLHRMSNTVLVRGDNISQQAVEHVQKFPINKNM